MPADIFKRARMWLVWSVWEHLRREAWLRWLRDWFRLGARGTINPDMRIYLL